MTGERILLVDDDEMFRESLIQNLSDAGFGTQSYGDGPSALRDLANGDLPDVILLDWKMPQMTGIEVLRDLRRQNIDVPVVFLTVLIDEFYEEAGLVEGAVDFIEKSRSFSILLRRLDVILQGRKGRDTGRGDQEPTVLTVGGIRLHRDTKRAYWNETQIDLTLTEFKMVEYLVMRAGLDVRYRELYDIVHGEGFAAGAGEVGYRANVRAFIKRIRQKFRDVDPEFNRIENYPGFGYRWGENGGV